MKTTSQDRTLRFLEKFKKSRLHYDLFSDDSDLERLRIAEAGYHHFILLFSIAVVIIISGDIFSGESKNLWKFIFGGFFVILICHLAFELFKIRKAIDLFLKQAPQTIDSLLQNLNKKNAEQSGRPNHWEAGGFDGKPL